MRILCTICSSRKDLSTKLLPARERYVGDHIKKMLQIASEQESHFYILSGKYGLIHSDKKIPLYDHLLVEENVEKIVKTITRQLKEIGVSEIVFYTKDEPSWAPYKYALLCAAKICNIPVEVRLLL